MTGGFSRVLRWSVFAALLFLFVALLWFDVANDCTGQGNYSGCPHHLVDPLPLLVPYGLALAAFLGAVFASAKAGLSDIRSTAMATVLLVAVLTALEWWLTGDFWLINF